MVTYLTGVVLVPGTALCYLPDPRLLQRTATRTHLPSLPWKNNPATSILGKPAKTPTQETIRTQTSKNAASYESIWRHKRIKGRQLFFWGGKGFRGPFNALFTPDQVLSLNPLGHTLPFWVFPSGHLYIYLRASGSFTSTRQGGKDGAPQLHEFLKEGKKNVCVKIKGNIIFISRFPVYIP